MIEPGIYQVSGTYSTFIGVVEVLEVTDEHVKCRRTDGQEVTMKRNIIETLKWKRLDQAVTYGNDCRDGRCEF